MKIQINYIKEKNCDGLDVKDFDWGTIRVRKITLKFDSLSSRHKLKKYINKIIKYRKWLEIKDEVTINLYNYNENNILIKNFANLVAAIIKSHTLKELYDKAYVLSCDYLDFYFYQKNACDFCDNKCGEKKTTNITTGCCHYFRGDDNKVGIFSHNPKLILCDYLQKDGKCSIKSIGCKLFTCDYLNKKGIKFRTNDIFSIYAVFNWIQKLILTLELYTPQEITIDKLLKVPNFKFINKFFKK